MLNEINVFTFILVVNRAFADHFQIANSCATSSLALQCNFSLIDLNILSETEWNRRMRRKTTQQTTAESIPWQSVQFTIGMAHLSIT